MLEVYAINFKELPVTKSQGHFPSFILQNLANHGCQSLMFLKSIVLYKCILYSVGFHRIFIVL